MCGGQLLYISRCRKMCEVASFKIFENSLTTVKVMTKTKLFIWDTVYKSRAKNRNTQKVQASMKLGLNMIFNKFKLFEQHKATLAYKYFRINATPQ